MISAELFQVLYETAVSCATSICLLIVSNIHSRPLQGGNITSNTTIANSRISQALNKQGQSYYFQNNRLSRTILSIFKAGECARRESIQL